MITAHDKMNFMKYLSSKFPAGNDKYKVEYLGILQHEYLTECFRLEEDLNRDEQELEFFNQWEFFVRMLHINECGASGPAPRTDMIEGVI